MFTEDDLLPISALQHLLFCQRQCALIHIEGLWAENRLTIEGRHLHDKAHGGVDESRKDVRIVRGLAVRSLRLGLSGVADVVEFHHGEGGRARAFPVEYKRGRPKKDDSDRVQLCAQALCLEEMLAPGSVQEHAPASVPARVAQNVTTSVPDDLVTSIPAGALYYGRTRRRLDVAFDQALRETTQRAAEQLHELIRGGITPRVPRQPKCEQCSMLNLCLPDTTGPGRSASRYLQRSLARAAAGPPREDDEL